MKTLLKQDELNSLMQSKGEIHIHWLEEWM